MFTSAALAMNEASRPDLLDRSGVLTVREHAGAPLSTQGVGGASGLKLEDFAPVRSTTAYKGQRNFSGEWWCSTNLRMVPYESWLERDHLMSMDYAPKIIGIASQPFRIDFKLPDGPRWHVPDYFARLRDGSALVVDVRPTTGFRIGTGRSSTRPMRSASDLAGGTSVWVDSPASTWQT